ncbi:MAG: ATP-dependent sacrificial sulfur transferase LarE [Methanosarcinales archaeon]|nr:ATP-dependent sacrificial sulfur transferase LarE [Methanosarcinales archaeon]
MDEIPDHDFIYLQDKIEKIVDNLRCFNGVLVAFSGGVDSSTLAALAYKALGNKAVAVTANSPILSERELKSAKKTIRSIGIRHIIIPFDILQEPGFTQNPKGRCYYCKSFLYGKLNMLAAESGLKAVADGTNASELNEHRPGYKAILENGIKTPFIDMDITKHEIRQIARSFGLSVWDKPQQTCLLTRFPYGRMITLTDLKRVEMAEDYLYCMGIKQCRIRDHVDSAHIEFMNEDMDVIMKNKECIVEYFKKLGYANIVFVDYNL